MQTTTRIQSRGPHARAAPCEFPSRRQTSRGCADRARRTWDQPIEDKEQLVGQTLPLKMIEADEVRSHRARPWPSRDVLRAVLALCPS